MEEASLCLLRQMNWLSKRELPVFSNLVRWWRIHLKAVTVYYMDRKIETDTERTGEHRGSGVP
jgi:hypothetical protein